MAGLRFRLPTSRPPLSLATRLQRLFDPKNCVGCKLAKAAAAALAKQKRTPGTVLPGDEV